MAKILPPGANIATGLEETPFDKLLKLLAVGQGIGQTMQKIGERRDTSVYNTLSSGNRLLQSADDPGDLDMISNMLNNIDTNTPELVFAQEALRSDLEDRKEVFATLQQHGNDLFSTINIADPNYSNKLGDWSPSQLIEFFNKKHQDLGGEGFLTEVTGLLEQIGIYKTIHGSAVGGSVTKSGQHVLNPHNFNFKYKPDGADEITINSVDFSLKLNRFEENLQKVLLVGLDESNIINEDEAAHFFRGDINYLYSIKEQKINDFYTAYTNSSNGLINMVGKLMQLNNNVDSWDAYLNDATVQAELDSILTDDTVREKFILDLNLPTTGDVDSDKLLVSQALLSGKHNKGDITTIINALKDEYTTIRDMTKEALIGWGGGDRLGLVPGKNIFGNMFDTTDGDDEPTLWGGVDVTNISPIIISQLEDSFTSWRLTQTTDFANDEAARIAFMETDDAQNILNKTAPKDAMIFGGVDVTDAFNVSPDIMSQLEDSFISWVGTQTTDFATDEDARVAFMQSDEAETILNQIMDVGTNVVSPITAAQVREDKTTFFRKLRSGDNQTKIMFDNMIKDMPIIDSDYRQWVDDNYGDIIDTDVGVTADDSLISIGPSGSDTTFDWSTNFTDTVPSDVGLHWDIYDILETDNFNTNFVKDVNDVDKIVLGWIATAEHGGVPSADSVFVNKSGIYAGSKDIGIHQINESWINKSNHRFSFAISKIDGREDEVYNLVQDFMRSQVPGWDDLRSEDRREYLKDGKFNSGIAAIIYKHRGLGQWSDKTIKEVTNKIETQERIFNRKKDVVVKTDRDMTVSNTADIPTPSFNVDNFINIFQSSSTNQGVVTEQFMNSENIAEDRPSFMDSKSDLNNNQKTYLLDIDNFFLDNVDGWDGLLPKEKEAIHKEYIKKSNSLESSLTGRVTLGLNMPKISGTPLDLLSLPQNVQYWAQGIPSDDTRQDLPLVEKISTNFEWNLGQLSYYILPDAQIGDYRFLPSDATKNIHGDPSRDLPYPLKFKTNYNIPEYIILKNKPEIASLLEINQWMPSEVLDVKIKDINKLIASFKEELSTKISGNTKDSLVGSMKYLNKIKTSLVQMNQYNKSNPETVNSFFNNEIVAGKTARLKRLIHERTSGKDISMDDIHALLEGEHGPDVRIKIKPYVQEILKDIIYRKEVLGEDVNVEEIQNLINIEE